MIDIVECLLCPGIFPGGSDSKESICNAEETQVQSLGQEDPLQKGMATHSSILLGKSHRQRSLVGYNPWDCEESERTEHTHTHNIYIYIYTPHLYPFLSWQTFRSPSLSLGVIAPG